MVRFLCLKQWWEFDNKNIMSVSFCNGQYNVIYLSLNKQRGKMKRVLFVSVLFASLLFVSCSDVLSSGSDNNNEIEETIAIGIPSPSFGIAEIHTMYEGLLFEQGDFTYRDAGNGPYSHYIDNESTDCSDTDNPYGTLEKPRRSIPDTLPAGSVVEVHGKEYTRVTKGNPQFIIRSLGTKEQPVFVRGFSNETKTSFSVSIKVVGKYMIFENFYMDKSGFAIPYTQNGVTAHASNISVRHCELEGSGEVGHGSAISVRTLNHDDLVENIVIYKNEIHHYGKHDHTSENDYHGVGVGANAKNIYILNNHIHHNGGDAIQVNFYSSLPDLLPQYIYIGQNEMHDDAENAVDLKGCRDVIVSQNNVYNYDGFTGTENTGTPMVTHYGSPSSNIAKRVWYIFNEIHDSFGAASAVTSGPNDVYFVSNKIYNIKNSDNSAVAFLSWSSGNQFIVNNTIVNSDVGISYSSGNGNYSVRIENNIFSNLTTSKYVKLDYTAYTDNAIIFNNLFYHESVTPEIDGNDDQSILSSPDFVNLERYDLNLNPSSPAYQTGLLSAVFQKFRDNYGINIDKDYNGNTIDTPSNIGAY